MLTNIVIEVSNLKKIWRVLIVKEYEMIITIKKNADDRYDAEEQIGWILELLDKESEHYTVSAYCVG